MSDLAVQKSGGVSVDPESVWRLLQAFGALLAYAERSTCLHESTYRGGAIWEICDNCGRKWADDTGGMPPDAHEYPKEIREAQAVVDEWSHEKLRALQAAIKATALPEKLHRPTTRGELAELLVAGEACEVVDYGVEMTEIMLRHWLNAGEFKIVPSRTPGWVVFIPEKPAEDKVTGL